MLDITFKMATMQDVLKKLRQISDSPDISDVAGRALVAGVQRQFDRAQDPETGASWPKLKSRNGKPLQNLKKTIVYLASSNKRVAVGSTFRYASVHNKGRVIEAKGKVLAFEVFGMTVFARRVVIPQRRFLPESEVGLQRVGRGLMQPAIDAYYARIDKG